MSDYIKESMYDKISKVVKDIVLVSATLLTVIFGSTALFSWKENIKNPIRQVIIQKEVDQLIPVFDYLASIEHLAVIQSSIPINFAYYYSFVDKNFYLDSSSTGEYFAKCREQFINGQHKFSFDSKEMYLSSSTNLIYPYIQIDTTTWDFLTNVKSIASNHYFSIEIRDQADDIVNDTYSFLNHELILSIDNSLNEFVVGENTNKYELLVNVYNQTNAKNEEIINKTKTLYNSIRSYLRIDELYKI